ncbi:hypothetical protein PROVRUST_05127 [Providencia rustigianii DSM 4541]|uniref:Uncharacterized protein n=1 Tax=Providencia rustigianii DSM 4541 TaxID=500637 RepID=D1NY06_9GAMM|nr:hypothetical protein PROVRUST_05127 [Providencia rustigianii DSM 4541]
MTTKCLFTKIQDRLSIHHEISMVRLLTGFFISEMFTYVT